MEEKNIYGRYVQRHDTQANWENTENFIPKAGEIIVYDRDDLIENITLKGNHTYERIKIGDGVTNVNLLPFLSEGILNETKAYIEETLLGGEW